MSDKNVLKIEFENRVLLDRLYELSIEYSTSPEQLIIISVGKLLDDIDLVRKLRKLDEIRLTDYLSSSPK